MALYGRVNKELYLEYLKKAKKRQMSKEDWEGLIVNLMNQLEGIRKSETVVKRIELDLLYEEVVRDIAKSFFGSKKCSITGILNMALWLEVKGYGKEKS